MCHKLTDNLYQKTIFQGEVEFIGRAMARPLVKKAETKYEAPLFPPKLEWFQIYRGDLAAGEVLAAFELFEVRIYIMINHRKYYIRYYLNLIDNL